MKQMERAVELKKMMKGREVKEEEERLTHSARQGRGAGSKVGSKETKSKKEKYKRKVGEGEKEDA